jgi:hypothetical protein
MSFDAVRAIADAVLLEGYVLYPYRASSRKNQFRFAFGVLAPERWSAAGGCEPWWMETQCLVEGDAPRIEGCVRFLQVVRRTVEEARGSAFVQVGALEAGGQLRIPWDEGAVREVPFEASMSAAEGGIFVPFEIAGGREHEELREGDRVVGRVAWSRRTLRGRIAIHAERLEARVPLRRVTIRVSNVTEGDPLDAPREAILAASCTSTHILLAAREGAFVSLLDPPEHAREAAASCENVRCYPVLAGPEGARDLVLSSPIILYDHPKIAPESPGDFFDAGEIDELLALRTATLTPEEKRAARATDPRAAEIVDRVEALPPEVIERLHGAIRELGPASPSIARGSRVRLRTGHRRTDAQDMLLVGRTATVEAVLQDVDGRDCFAVTIDDDPAAELHRWYGRFHYYYADEVEPVS